MRSCDQGAGRYPLTTCSASRCHLAWKQAASRRFLVIANRLMRRGQGGVDRIGGVHMSWWSTTAQYMALMLKLK